MRWTQLSQAVTEVVAWAPSNDYQTQTADELEALDLLEADWRLGQAQAVMA